MRVSISIILVVALASNTLAQVYSDKVVSLKHEALKDSLTSTPYPYILPIWGDKAAQRGFDLPYSAGLNVNYLSQKSDITINNLQVGFNHGPLYNLDEIVRFNKATSTTNGLNFRPDIWLFPFLNIYGIFAKSTSATSIDFVGVRARILEGSFNATRKPILRTTYRLWVHPREPAVAFSLDMKFRGPISA